jgi:hypothetical protein
MGLIVHKARAIEIAGLSLLNDHKTCCERVDCSSLIIPAKVVDHSMPPTGNDPGEDADRFSVRLAFPSV